MPDIVMKKTRKAPPPLRYGQQKVESSFPWHQRSEGTTRTKEMLRDANDHEGKKRIQYVEKKCKLGSVKWCDCNLIRKNIKWPKPGALIKSLTHRTVGQVHLLWRWPTFLGAPLSFELHRLSSQGFSNCNMSILYFAWVCNNARVHS